MFCEEAQKLINSVGSKKPIKNKYLLASAVKHVEHCRGCQMWVNETFDVASTRDLKKHVGITDLFTSPLQEEAFKLYLRYTQNPQIMKLEHAGFVEGLKRGKTDKVPLEIIVTSLEKQWGDFLATWTGYKNLPKTKTTTEDLKRTLADLRNVAGIIFLKLNEGGDRK